MSVSGEGFSETVPSREVLASAPRLVVFGNFDDFYEGTYKEVTDGLKAAAATRKPGLKVVMAGELRYVKDMFLGRWDDEKPPLIYNNDLNVGPKGVAQTNQPDTIPQAVVVFPNIRHHDSWAGVTLLTPVEMITELCAQHGVPMVRIEGELSAEAIGQLVDILIPTE